MKNALYALVLANLLMGGWWLSTVMTSPTKPQVEIPVPAPGVERLRLLSEVQADSKSVAQQPPQAEAPGVDSGGPENDQDQSGIPAGGEPEPVDEQAEPADEEADTETESTATTSAPDTQPVPAPDPWACYRFSPSSDPAQIDTLREELLALGAENIRKRQDKLSRATGNWIMIPPARSRGDAQATARKLEASGFTDYYVVPNGQWKNAISLGLFSDRENAARRIARLKQKGFQAHREVRYEEVPASVLEVALPADAVPPSTLDPQSMDCGSLLP